jgi:hypothetical protein
LKSIKIKNLPELRSIVFGYFKMKKHSNRTLLTEWNSLIPGLIILVAGINVNDDFLYLPLKSSNSLSHFSNQGYKNNEKKKFWFKIDFVLKSQNLKGPFSPLFKKLESLGTIMNITLKL